MDNQQTMFNFIAHMSLVHFCWCVFAERIRTRGIKGNYYKLNMGNKFFDVDLKLTIKRVPTSKEKQEIKKEVGIDFDRITKELQS